MENKLNESLLDECRDLIAQQMGMSVLHTLEDAEKTLYQLAKKESSHGKAKTHYDAIRGIRIKKREIRIRFEKRFTSIFDYAVNNLFNENSNVTLSKIGHKSFVKYFDGDDVRRFEESIRKIRERSSCILNSLEKKLNSLMNNVYLNEYNTPLKPETVYEAFWESCRDIKMDNKYRKLLLGIFEKYALFYLTTSYEELDHYLENRIKGPGCLVH